MAWVMVDRDGYEYITEKQPKRYSQNTWLCRESKWLCIPKGSIAKLIGRELTWEHEPVELMEPKDK